MSSGFPAGITHCTRKLIATLDLRKICISNMQKNSPWIKSLSYTHHLSIKNTIYENDCITIRWWLIYILLSNLCQTDTFSKHSARRVHHRRTDTFGLKRTRALISHTPLLGVIPVIPHSHFTLQTPCLGIATGIPLQRATAHMLPSLDCRTVGSGLPVKD